MSPRPSASVNSAIIGLDNGLPNFPMGDYKVGVTTTFIVA